jgi:hypothetical protein
MSDETDINYDNNSFISHESTDSIGYVYILFRPDNPGLAKVGFTSISSRSRALNYTDGEWRVHKEFPMPVWLARLSEKTAHAYLKQYWLDPKITGGTASEIFTCSLNVAEEAVNKAFVDQLRCALRSLRLPESLVKVVLEQYGNTESNDVSVLLTKIESDFEKIKVQQDERVCELLEQIEFLKNQIELRKRELTKASSLPIYYKTKYQELEDVMNNMRKMTANELLLKEEELKRFYRKKVSFSHYELLRDNYRNAIDLIETYRIRDSQKK